MSENINRLGSPNKTQKNQIYFNHKKLTTAGYVMPTYHQSQIFMTLPQIVPHKS